jgi:transcriptional regulator with XRE-family HTH domain
MLDLAKVKSLRAKAGLTQQRAAERAGLGTRQSWNAIESGRKANVTLEVLDKIAKALNVKSRELLK